MDFIKTLYEKVNFHPLQGYALFYYHNGKTYEACQGKLGDESSSDITFNSNFRLASVTKQFIAFSIVQDPRYLQNYRRYLKTKGTPLNPESN